MWDTVTQAPRPFRRVVYRKLGRDEGHLRRAHLRRLTPEDRRARFMGNPPRTRGGIVRLPKPDIMVAVLVDGTLRGIAELYLDPTSTTGHAEVAITVERRFQGRGLGTALAERMLVIAGNRGIHHVTLLCADTNLRMQRIARKLGAHRSSCNGETISEIELPPASPASFMLERLDDASLLAGRLMGFLTRPRRTLARAA